jgi:hypothetical protein
MVYVRGKLALGNHFPHAWAEPLPPVDGVVGVSRGSTYLILECADAGAADAALRAASVEWERLQLPVNLDSGGKWRIAPRTEEVAVLERRGRYILAVSGGREESEALASLLKKILGG